MPLGGLRGCYFPMQTGATNLVVRAVQGLVSTAGKFLGNQNKHLQIHWYFCSLSKLPPRPQSCKQSQSKRWHHWYQPHEPCNCWGCATGCAWSGALDWRSRIEFVVLRPVPCKKWLLVSHCPCRLCPIEGKRIRRRNSGYSGPNDWFLGTFKKDWETAVCSVLQVRYFPIRMFASLPTTTALHRRSERDHWLFICEWVFRKALKSPSEAAFFYPKVKVQDVWTFRTLWLNLFFPCYC